MLGPEHVGRRVVVRTRLADAAPGRRFRDVIGELIEFDADRLRVLPSAGAAVTVDAATVVASKVVGPKPTPFSQILSLERDLAATWPAVETDDLGGWLLRYSNGFSRRANSVLARTVPDSGLDEALAQVERWYRDRGARPLISVALPVARRLDTALASRGWVAEAETAVLVKAAEPVDYDGEASIVNEPGPQMLAQLGRGRDATAARVLGSGPDRAYAEIRRDGELAAHGRAATAGGTAVLSGIGTLPTHRRQGLGRQILEALSAWAAAAGAERLAVQVETDNAAALALYERLGFSRRYRYRYRAAP